ncbi:MAG: hypothetical protein PHE83_05795 [Opitutaceae bacterium]|nr:hypothetical protein [Opitutaceae bacterium]
MFLCTLGGVIRPTAHLFGFCPPQVKPDGHLILPARKQDGEIIGLCARRDLWRKAALEIMVATAPPEDPASPVLKPSGHLL